MNDDTTYLPGRGVLAEVDIGTLKRHGDSIKFTYHDRFGMESEGFLLRFRDSYVAYENRCPHWSVPLDAEENQFLDSSESFVFCPMHGAGFDAMDGSCFQGPCEGDALERLEVSIDGDRATIRSKTLRLFSR